MILLWPDIASRPGVSRFRPCTVASGSGLCLCAGLDEAVQQLAEQKVDASGMDTYTQEMSKVCCDTFNF